MPTEESFDVVVVGGGPSGSTTASFVAMQGHRVLLLEKETFPRYQIGESLLPSTVHGICGLLGIADRIGDAGFVRKHGGTFRWGTNPEPWSFSFAISPRIAGPTSHAFQVERMKFDQLLLDRARELGVDVREECTVTEVVEGEDRVVGLRYVDTTGGEHKIQAQFVVDASGNKTRISRSVGTRTYSDFFRNVALFGYFTGGARMPEPRQGNIFCAAFDQGWFWYIPLSAELTSVGAVVHHDHVSAVQGDLEESLLALIDRCAPIRQLLSGASRVTAGPYGQIRVRKDYSYLNNSFWRPGMVLVGDAACFVDPVFSSGVHLATYGALLAARSINSVLAGNVAEEQSFTEFEARYRHEYGLFYEFLISFYDMNVDDSSYFWQAKKVTNCEYSELESFVDLVGGIASQDAAFLDVESTRARLKASARELEESVGTTVTGNSADPSTALYQSDIVRKVMGESTQLQALALLGEDSDARPLFAGGLIPAVDGLSWVAPEP
jgi:halogenation protein CepH